MCWVRACHTPINKRVDGELAVVTVPRRPHFKRFGAIREELGDGGLAAPRIIVPPHNHKALHDDLCGIWVRYLMRRGYDAVGDAQPIYSKYGDAPRRSAHRSDGLVTRNSGAVRHHVEVIRTNGLGAAKSATLDAFNHDENVTIWVFDVGPPSVLVRLLALYDHWVVCAAAGVAADTVAAEEAIMRYAKGPCIVEFKKSRNT